MNFDLYGKLLITLWKRKLKQMSKIDQSKLAHVLIGGPWKQPAVPRTAVQVIPIDAQGLILTQYRGPQNRSARNVWSWVTGLHEIGETILECAVRELYEELELKPISPTAIMRLGVYENIAGDADAEEQYHWVLNVIGIKVRDIAGYVNKEPVKHDKIEVLPCTCFLDAHYWKNYNYHPSFTTFAQNNETLVKDLKALAWYA